MNLSVDLLLRVLYPLVGRPHGDTGGRAAAVFPSPPPRGAAAGLLGAPRTCGRCPIQRLRPALPIETFSWSMLPTWPIVAKHSMKILRISLLGILTDA